MKKIKWERFERHLREALGPLASLHDYAKAKAEGKKVYKRWTDGQLGSELAHIYHHLNFAWNTRFMSEETAEADFETNQIWPTEPMFAALTPPRSVSILEEFGEHYAKAVDLVREKKDACISMFQNELGLGFIESMIILKIMKKSGLLLGAAGD